MKRTAEVGRLIAENYTQTEIATMLGISKQRVNQILNPLKHYARSHAYNAKLQKPNKCSRCKLIKPLQGHHRDYNDALNVVWLCSKCHGIAHTRPPASRWGKSKPAKKCDKCDMRTTTKYHKRVCVEGDKEFAKLY